MNLLTRPYDPILDSIEGGAAFPLMGGLVDPLGYASSPLLGQNVLYTGDNSFDNVNVVLPGTLGASSVAPGVNMLGVGAIDNLPDRRVDISDATIVAGNRLGVL